MLYDQALPDQRQRATALYELVGVLQRCRAFSPDTREALTSAATTACLRLLTRREQCRALCAAAYLWWQQQQPADAAALPGAYPPVRDGAKVSRQRWGSAAWECCGGPTVTGDGGDHS